MKLLEKAFVRYLFAICAAMAAACTASAAPNIVYLKADATGDGSGQNWANACTDIAAAVGKLETASEERQVIYAAQGVYVVNATITAVKNFELYGGFKGDETGTEEEMLAARDWDAYQTIFTGDQGGDDTWVHIVPSKNDLSAPAYISTDEPVIKDDKVNLPAYTGTYDTYVIKKPGSGTAANTAQNFSVGTEKGTVVIDGIWSLSFYNLNGTFLKDPGGTSDTTSLYVRNCRMVGHRSCWGNNIGSGVYFGNVNRAHTEFANCRILNCSQDGPMTMYGNATFHDCEFTGIAVIPATASDAATCVGGHGCGFSYWYGNNNAASDCSFTRTVRYGSLAGQLFSAPSSLYKNCTYTNNFAVSSSDTYAYVRIGQGYMTNCCFRGNFLGFSAAAGGKSYAFVQGIGSGSWCHGGMGEMTFENNEVAAKLAASPGEGEYSLAMVGHAGDGSKPLMVFNTGFIRNKMSAESNDAVNGIACDAVAEVGITANLVPEVGMGCCTVVSRGDPGVYSMTQVGENLSTAFIVVDCLFMSDGDKPSPFRFLRPDLVTMQSCSVKNVLTPPTGITSDGWTSDEIPLERYTFMKGTVEQTGMRIAALPPGASVAADVYPYQCAHYGSGSMTYKYRADSSSSWKPICSTYYNSATSYGKPILPVTGVLDPEDVRREFGAYSRGAIQTPTVLAMTGKTLTLRRDPLTGGTFTGPAVQAVAAGTAPQQVTVVPAEGRSFDGWYNENGEKISGENTLSLDPLDDDLVLTARFASPKVTLTFELGDFASYGVGGGHTYEVELQPGATFSPGDIPAYAANAGWHLLGWDKALPQQVPDVSETWTMTGVTTALRRIYLVPPEDASETQDGTSWATAYGSFSAAYADAAKYRGEVWVKEGVHPVYGQIVPKANVSVCGGFEGTESARPLQTSRRSVISGGTDTDSIAYLFYNADGVLTNVEYTALVFTNFSSSVLLSKASKRSSVQFADCVFAGVRSPLNLSNTALEMVRCEVHGATTAVKATMSADFATDGEKNVIADCMFEDGKAFGNSDSVGVTLSGTMTSYLTNCLFRGNYAYGAYGTKAGNAALSLSGVGVCEVVGCSFVSNHTARNAANVVGVGSSARFERCLFDGNLVEGREAVVGGNISDGARSAGVGVSGGEVVLNGCLFRDQVLNANVIVNEPHGAYVNHPNVVWSAIGAVAGGSLTLLNCTAEGTFVACNPTDVEKGSVSIGALVRASGNLALVNTQILGSTITNLYSAQIVCRGGSGTFAALNSIVGEASVSDGATAWRTNGSTQVYAAFANSHLHGIDLADFETSANRAYAFDMVAEPPHYGSARRVDPATGFAMPVVQGPAPYLRGRGVYLKDNAVWFRDEMTDPAKPWRKAVDRTVFEADGSAVAPLLADGQVSDAFGTPRCGRHSTLGPLVGPPLGLTILVR